MAINPKKHEMPTQDAKVGECESASAAHSRAVDHYGVHRYRYRYTERTCRFNDELHHYERTYGDNHIKLFGMNAMYRIASKKPLNPTVTQMEIEAPLVAAKAKPGQFIILRPQV